VSTTLHAASPGGLVAGTPDLGQSTHPLGRAASGEDINRAASAARAFLRGYVPYSHRRRPAAAIPDATVALLTALTYQQPVIAPGQPAVPPRLVSLGASGERPAGSRSWPRSPAVATGTRWRLR